MSRGERILSVLAAVYDILRLISSVVFEKGSGIQQHRLLVVTFEAKSVFGMLHWSATRRFVVLSHGSGRLMGCE